MQVRELKGSRNMAYDYILCRIIKASDFDERHERPKMHEVQCVADLD